MAIREVGPGKTYATIASAAAAASDGDTIECYFDTVDTSFLYEPPAVTIQAATGFSPKWRTAGSFLATCIRALTVDGLEIGHTSFGTVFFNAVAYAAAGFGVTLRNCVLNPGPGTPGIMGAGVQAVGSVPMSLTLINCKMSDPADQLGGIMALSGASGTRLCKGTLHIDGCTLKTNGIRTVSANGLFVEQHITDSIIQVVLNDGANNTFDTGSTFTLHQSILDGLTTATGLITADCAKTTVDVKNSYIMRCAGTAVSLTNCAATDMFDNCAFIDNVTAISAANTVTDHCLFDNNTADYAGGGALDATDLTGTVTFNDLANGDYSPTDLSDTIDVGVDAGFVTDIRGEARPQGLGFDIGPYEYPVVTPVTYDSEYTSGATIICTDLSGTSIPGYNPYDLFPAINDPLVSLAQIVLVSLFSDRVAGYDDELPAGQVDRRGWFADTADEKIGSRLWLDEGAAVVDDTLDRNRRWVDEALAHLTRDGLATSVEIDMEIVESADNPSEAMLVTQITARLDETRGVILKFSDLWGL